MSEALGFEGLRLVLVRLFGDHGNEVVLFDRLMIQRIECLSVLQRMRRDPKFDKLTQVAASEALTKCGI